MLGCKRLKKQKYQLYGIRLIIQPIIIFIETIHPVHSMSL